jgi:hypothetical protein
MFFSIVNIWFACGLIVGTVAGWYAFGGKFGLMMNLLIMTAPTTLLVSLLGISTAARYSLALSISFAAVSLIKGDCGIAQCLLVGIATGICAFALVVAIELIEKTIEICKDAGEEAEDLIKDGFLELKDFIATCKNRALQIIKIQQ